MTVYEFSRVGREKIVFYGSINITLVTNRICVCGISKNTERYNQFQFENIYVGET